MRWNNKPIKDFEPNYWITSDGYYQVGLYKSGKCYYKSIARLVAQAFILNLGNKSEINHKDGIKANNNKSNLEWVTHQENIRHAFRMGLIKRSPNAGKPKVSVKAFSYFTGRFLASHSSLHDAARMHGVSKGSISSVLTGRCKQVKGLTFKRILNISQTIN